MESMQKVLRSLDAIIANTESALAAAAGAPEAPAAAEKAAAAGKNSEKKNKKKKAAKAAPAPAVPPATAQFLQCDLRVGKVTSVAHHPEADGLYVLKVSYGAAGERSVCAGLRGYVAEDALRGRLVVTICNLKPRVLRGVPSEAMILAGSVRADGAKEAVAPLAPPPAAAPGDVVAVQGMAGERTVADGKFVSGKTWDKVVPRLAVIGGKACYDGGALVVGDGAVQCALPDGAEIH